MKIFPLSDSILLPLAPTIARAIADYLQSIAQKLKINALQNWASDVIELQPDLYRCEQFQRSIRQIPTLQYQYVSTIAHQLAAKLPLTSLEICQNLDLPIPALAVLEKSVHLELDCWYNKDSYIYFQLTPESIKIWLNYIHDLPVGQLGFTATSTPTASMLQGRDFSSLRSRSVSFREDASRTRRSALAEPALSAYAHDLAIYAHARCCSLLKLAASEKVVRITTDWQISKSNYLFDRVDTENRLRTESNCIFEHPAEQRLIQTLMAVLDAIYGNNWQLESLQPESNDRISRGGFNGHRKSPNWTKLTMDLAQSWLEFDRRCQIFGEVKLQNPRLAIARCGLTAISRRYLQVLLEIYLGVEAAVEL